MQILPENDSKVVPLAILGLVLLLVYFIGFHWFFQAHARLNDEIGTQADDYQRLKAMANRREELAASLKELQENQQNTIFFRSETNVNSAAASMTNRLKQIIEAEAESARSCRLLSNQTVRQRGEQLFPEVTVNIRLACPLDEFVRILHTLEGDVPLVFVDNINIYQRTQRRGNEAAEAEQDIRFNMSAYLKN